MDEEISIVDTNTRNEKIRNFFVKNKKILIVIISTIFLTLGGYFFYNEVNKKNNIKLSNLYNSSKINYKSLGKNEKTISDLIILVKKKDKTYSPLALYFLIDNNLIDNKNDVNDLFNFLIDKTNIELEIKNLLIYKKALFNSDFMKENELIQILNPIINSNSIWKSHALYLMAEFFYANKEKEKAKEFFNQILILSNNNADIRLESKKRLNRDLSE